MNSLYTLGVRQTNSIQADLERLRTGDASASLLGLYSLFICLQYPPNARVSNIQKEDGVHSETLTADCPVLSLSSVRADFRLVTSNEQDGGRLRLDG